jgi:hypothetical protein
VPEEELLQQKGEKENVHDQEQEGKVEAHAESFV